jgi:hypothetical protein
MTIYDTTPIEIKTFKKISPFISIDEDIDERTLRKFDEILAKNGRFCVYQTYFTCKDTGQRMVKSTLFNHEGEEVDYRAYVTWSQTIHLRFERVLRNVGAKFRNPFIAPECYPVIIDFIQKKGIPYMLQECKFNTVKGCVVNESFG